MKKLLLLIFFTISIVFFPFKTYADQKNFSTSYKVTYDIGENQITRVTLDIGLKNKTSDTYVASYGIQTGFENISNIKVNDGSGPLNFDVQKSEIGNEISFIFKEKTVGINNIHKFNVSFDTSEISKNFGSVWEVNIPGISDQAQYDVFNVEVKTPDSIGPASIIKPAVSDLKKENNSIFFTKKDLGNSGISIAYGDFQTYKFDLKYHIQNRKVIPQTTEIAIPSDNNYQKVSINDINPKPIDVIIDSDGNWLARYKLLPSQKLDISVSGNARISNQPKKEELTNEEKNMYLKSDHYWEVNDQRIKNIAKQLKTPRAIYNYTVNNLKYDTQRIKETQIRAGAKNVLEDKVSAVCLEFTDLFVTLARAAGIPARAVEGYANTSNSADRPLSLVQDVLHAWPQYYDEDKQAWIMVDPTWENTTKGIDYFDVFDFDHFAFVIKGKDSDYPVPAGGYKLSKNKENKDVSVTPISTVIEAKPAVSFTSDFSKKFYGGFPMEGNIIVLNNSKVLAEKQKFKVTVEGLSPNSQELSFDAIPPYGKKIIPIRFHTLNPLTNKTFIVKIEIGKEIIEKEIKVEPFYKNKSFILIFGGILIGIFTIIISFFIYRARRLYFPK